MGALSRNGCRRGSPGRTRTSAAVRLLVAKFETSEIPKASTPIRAVAGAMGSARFERPTSASGTLLVCKQGYILSWQGAVRKMMKFLQG